MLCLKELPTYVLLLCRAALPTSLRPPPAGLRVPASPRPPPAVALRPPPPAGARSPLRPRLPAGLPLAQLPTPISPVVVPLITVAYAQRLVTALVAGDKQAMF
ncbi:uncharacterized protein BDR25DRAFT_319674 [Lindgomyces ingoldianus]|uniref:Uncharacterized protein n=1 Tax=Lindgomyces ingoldianus TaxID=673940 RepID=A0ACB6Q9R3_9PLEO|nr:uncharacterized protein BDR25DRAFT_319674 [Lindgomyces ingoldianus]KAF2463769.1 hypothetical protein BDR25DRAFT_319674 [Lindgomyces ingoldianus]